jgi:hypothetical protein
LYRDNSKMVFEGETNWRSTLLKCARHHRFEKPTNTRNPWVQMPSKMPVKPPFLAGNAPKP